MRAGNLDLGLTTFFASVLLATAPVHRALPADNRVDIAGDGPDVVLIPGLGEAGAIMKPIADHLAQCHHTHTFTLAGFAGQPGNRGLRLIGWEDSISEYVAALPLHQVVVIGSGVGGVLGLKLAIDHADQVQQLVVLDSLPSVAAATLPDATVDTVRSRANAAKQTFVTQPPDVFKAAQQQTLSSRTTHAEAVPMLVEWLLASDRAAIADAYYEVVTTDLRDAVAAIHATTLVLVPWDTTQPQDAATTLDMYRKQYQKLPQVHVQIVKGSRHFLTLDQPIATNMAIDEFVGKCP